MTANDFRKIVLALPETEERSHMNHPDFRVAGKIFATVGYPDKTRAMVKLSPEDQHYFSKDYPEVFTPVKGSLGTTRRHQCLPQGREERDSTKSSASRVAQHGTQTTLGVEGTAIWQGFHNRWEIGCPKSMQQEGRPDFSIN